ncbi:DNA-directed RNA polymerase III subunit rpc5 [Picochlorum sp. SENEW3]|nr:DNA-directed RNA polymerase III subunit rpc5 [Picochlorum sp. SENEW3]
MSLDSDDIVDEIDIVLSTEAVTIEGGLMPVLLQFPLREKDRPYSTGETAPRVKYKYNVQRMHWDVPLDTEGPNYYDGGVGETKRGPLEYFSLKSSRVHQGVGGMGVGFMKDNKLHLVPLQEVMQLRPSPNHLDDHKEKSTVLHPKEVPHQGNAKSELQPITVQIKKHETEQQTEARLRSYAFHAQKDEADEWCDLTYHGHGSDVSSAVQRMIEHTMGEPVGSDQYLDKMEYLDQLVPSTSTAATVTTVKMPYSGEGAVLNDIGKPAQFKSNDQPGSSLMLSNDSMNALGKCLTRLFEESAVISLNKIRRSLQQPHMTEQLVALGATGSDESLHACIGSFDNVVFIKHAYVRRLQGDSTLDPLRSIVLDILAENDVTKRGDIMELANKQGVAVTDNMYSRVMKELCISKGSSWSMKSGD